MANVNEYLHIGTFTFHKVVQQQISGEVVSSAVCCGVYNDERIIKVGTFGRIVAYTKVAHFM